VSAEIAITNTTCSAVPLQIEGMTDDGRHLYFRARGRVITLGVGGDLDEAVGGEQGCYLSLKGCGNYAAGWMPEQLGLDLMEWMFSAYEREQEIQAEESAS
jgi:hypothetical protein